MTPLDWTQPLALRRSPTVRFDGPFIGPDADGDRYAIVDGDMHRWGPDGERFGFGEDRNLDLIPLQQPPREWLRRWANVYDEFVLSYDDEGSARNLAMSTALRTAVPMIEKAAGDELAEVATAAEAYYRFWGLTTKADHARAALTRWDGLK